MVFNNNNSGWWWWWTLTRERIAGIERHRVSRRNVAKGLSDGQWCQVVIVVVVVIVVSVVSRCR